jgi:ubiquinone/menaquinone biosynthesis C-methylase UbiE
MQPEKSIKDYYAARAHEFDRVYAKPERQNDLRHLENWLPAVFSHRRVLEVACGTGYWTQFIAPNAAHVVATDATPQTLDIAQKRVTARNVDFHIADAYALPDQLGRFDAAFAGFWFSHVPRSRIGRFLDNLHARLEPRAVVLFLDNLYVEGSSSAITERDDEGNTYQSRKLADGTSHRVLKNFPSADDLIKGVEGIGKNPCYQQLEYYWVFQYEPVASN